jgi:hypothetical protein
VFAVSETYRMLEEALSIIEFASASEMKASEKTISYWIGSALAKM